MTMRSWSRRAAAVGIAAAAAALALVPSPTVVAAQAIPQYKVDPFWPKPLPNNWVIGEIAGVMADGQDNIWIIQRPATISDREIRLGKNPSLKCCTPAPPVIAFNPAGEVIHAWGGPGPGYDWPSNEHGVTVDPQGNVWVLGNGGGPLGPDGKPQRDRDDGMALKFTVDGRFLMQIGGRGSGNSLDTTRLNHAAKVVFDPKTNEAFIADGYGNHRVIVFDAMTGKYKRMWGAYGKPPTDIRENTGGDYPLNAPPKQFATVHCIMRSNDDLIYVCDRQNNRVQVFREDGTFVKEFLYPAKLDGFPGRVTDLAFWSDAKQSLLIINDGNTEAIHLVRRDDGKEVTQFGRPGHYAGEFDRQHVLAADSRGNIFAGEAGGQRVQKFVPSIAPKN